MEAAKVEMDCVNEVTAGASHAIANPGTPLAQEEHIHSHRSDPMPASSSKKRKSKVNNQVSRENKLNNSSPSVSNCYVFKSRLQEYAQKAGLTTPVYETIKEGPSHEPSFRSTVIVNNVRYDSLPGFFNRKAAEQSAAEVALTELAKSVDMKFGISQPVQETGLCKNLLQEYAQKMNYAMPLYQCRKRETLGQSTTFACTVEVGGIKYVGAAASTKKEAEIKAARIALLAIQSSAAPVSEDHAAKSSTYTVIPQKKKVNDLGISTQETAAALKPKKGRFKKQQRKRHFMKRVNPSQDTTVGSLEVNTEESGVTDAEGLKIKTTGNSECQVGEPSVTNAVKLQETLNTEESGVTDAEGLKVKTTGNSGSPVGELSVTNVIMLRQTDSGVETRGGDNEQLRDEIFA
ncbi:hypothetical protein CDL12_27402 [Handroanthus impetiginosus]|uniref:DRBM domain-containing protein n=1 Tax=Handroanthus impetiginosus TaxID=429701 RepID=A0A2G9G450_9LAMI|nr:hypothetical protein CDL12_27402 [Handroanthus impetiginosus]